MAFLLRDLILVLLALLWLSLLAQSGDECAYTVYIRTGSNIKGGTNAKISMSLGTNDGDTMEIPNLEERGLMDKDHDYFERGNLDIFALRGPCFDTPLCAVNLTSDGTGENHGWYCNYVEVTSTGAHIPCKQQLITIEQWLATDMEPNQLTASKNNCTAGGDKPES